MAAFCGRLDCLQMLVKHHATVDSVDHDGNTPGAYTPASSHFCRVYPTDFSDSKLKTHLFYKSFPPQILFHPPDCPPDYTFTDSVLFNGFFCFSFSIIFLVYRVYRTKLRKEKEKEKEIWNGSSASPHLL